MFFDSFGPVRTCSDALGYIQTHLHAFRRVRTVSENFRNFEFFCCFLKFLNDFARLEKTTFGEDYMEVPLPQRSLKTLQHIFVRSTRTAKNLSNILSSGPCGQLKTFQKYSRQVHPNSSARRKKTLRDVEGQKKTCLISGGAFIYWPGQH